MSAPDLTGPEVELLMDTLTSARGDLTSEIDSLKKEINGRMGHDPGAVGPYTLIMIEDLERCTAHAERLDALITRFQRGY